MQLGAQAEGRFLGQRYYQGAYHDVIRLAILHEDWNRVAPTLMDMLASLRSGAGAPPLAPKASVATEVEVLETLVELAADYSPQPGDAAASPAVEPVASNGHRGRTRRAKPQDTAEAD